MAIFIIHLRECELRRLRSDIKAGETFHIEEGVEPSFAVRERDHAAMARPIDRTCAPGPPGSAASDAGVSGSRYLGVRLFTIAGAA